MPETTIQLRRHYRELSERETDEVVDAVADLIVNFLTVGRHDAGHDGGQQERRHARERNHRDIHKMAVVEDSHLPLTGTHSREVPQ